MLSTGEPHPSIPPSRTPGNPCSPALPTILPFLECVMQLAGVLQHAASQTGSLPE